MADLTPDQKLAALFARPAAPARDPVFCAEVMERVARRRVWARMGAVAPWAGAAGLLGWALQPVLTPAVEDLAQALVMPASILSGTAVLVMASLIAARRLAR
jgi:hypothetical protein